MDAAHTPLTRVGSLFAAALLIAAPAFAAGIQVDSETVTLSDCAPSASVNVTTSPAGTDFVISQPPYWISVSQNNYKVTFSLNTSSYLVSGMSNPFTLSTVDGSAWTGVTVNYVAGASCGAGGGAFTVTPSPLKAGTSDTMALSATSAEATGTLAVVNSSAAAVNFTASVDSSSAGWLSVTPVSGTVGASGTASLAVKASPAGLTQGQTYTGTITVTPSGTQFQAVPIRVSFAVGTSAPEPSGNLTLGGTGLDTINLPLAYTPGGTSVPANVSLQSGAGATTFAVTSIQTSDGAAWLGAGGPSGISTSPAGGYLVSAGVSVGIAGGALNLEPGTYTGSIGLMASDGSTAVINVTLTVNSGAAGVTVTPGSLSFTVPAGSTARASLSFTISLDNNTTLVGITPASSGWLSVASAGNGNTYTATVNPSGLASGTYTGSIKIASSGPDGSGSTTVPVTLAVGSTSAQGPLTLGTRIVFSATVGGPTLTQSLSVTAASPTMFTAGVSSGSWLSISPDGDLQTDRTITVSANPAGLAAGTYDGEISLTSGGFKQSVQVTLQVGGSTGGNVTVTPASLRFSYQCGEKAPDPQKLNIASAQGTAAIPLTIATDGGAWLATSVTAGAATQYALTVTANPGALAPGTYQGTIQIKPRSGSEIDVPVTLAIQAAPTVSVPAASLEFSYQAGGQEPSPGILQVNGSTTGLTFGASVNTESGGDWLSVTPAAGTSPQTLSVLVSPGSLNPGTYKGAITVAGTGGAAGHSLVTVTLKVTAPLPTIDRIMNAASGTSGAIAPGELISIFAPADGLHPIGPAASAQTTLDESGRVATTLAGVQVLFSGYPAPLTYVSAGQINAVVPYELKNVGDNPYVQVSFLGQKSNALTLSKAAVTPGLFTANATGSGPAAILNSAADGVVSYNSPENPAVKGSTVVLYMTGEGETTPVGVTGTVTAMASEGPPTPQPLAAVGVTIDGQPANVTFWGEEPGMVAGVMQLNVVIPANARTGDLPIVVAVGGVSSQNNVTVSVK